MLTGGNDPPYVLPLVSSLSKNGIKIDLLGNDEMKKDFILANPNIAFYNFYGNHIPSSTPIKKITRVLKVYLQLFLYATKTKSKLFHIQWLNKFVVFDSFILNMYYKILGKKLVHTAHNINAGERDGNDSLLNRLAIRFLYSSMNHIFVHTNKMKSQLVNDYRIEANKITVIPFGINNSIPTTSMSSNEARIKLKLEKHEKNLLFFGNITPYKGLKYLVLALPKLINEFKNIRLIIAGRVNKNGKTYWQDIQKIIAKNNLSDYIIKRIELIPDEEVEIYCKSADAMILPYIYIFQSGVLFLAYNFGLPVIATDVGSLREDVLEGKTGYICNPEDPEDLSKKIDVYFKSDMYKNLNKTREYIKKYANDRYSWENNSSKTYEVYKKLL